MRFLIFAATLFALSACTWVELSPQGSRIKVASADVSNRCQQVGEIRVSVLDKLVLYHRETLKVRDELETLARNEAISLRADTIWPISPPIHGEQKFAAYRCR